MEEQLSVQLTDNKNRPTTADAFILRCENHHELLTNGLWKAFQSKQGVDLNVNWGGRFFQAHRLILDAFLSSDKLLITAEQQYNGNDLDCLLELIYLGHVTVRKDRLGNLLEIAQKSDFKLLVDALETPVVRNSTTKNATQEETDPIEIQPETVDHTLVDGLGDYILPDQYNPIDDAASHHRQDKTQSELVAMIERPDYEPKRMFGKTKRLVDKKRVEKVKQIIKCEQCDKIFDKPCRLKYHMRVHEGKSANLLKPPEVKHVCTICNKQFRLEDAFQRHKLTHEAGEAGKAQLSKRYQCHLCDKTFSSSSNRKSHIRIHTGERPYVCNQCGKGFAVRVRLKYHQLSHSGAKPFQCQQCQRCFVSPDTLQCHLKTHTDLKPHMCNICSKTFRKKEHMENHRTTHFPDKPYLCHICSRGFGDKSSMYSHIRYTHGTEKRPNYNKSSGVGVRKCEFCDKEFSISYLYNHKRQVHSQLKPHKCSFGECTKAFWSRTQLEVHQRVHTGQKPFKCDICGQEFRQLAHIRRHKVVHTGEKPFKCGVCYRSFVNAQNLDIHKRTIHTTDRIAFKCDACGKSYLRPDKLRKHVCRAVTQPSTDNTPN